MQSQLGFYNPSRVPQQRCVVPTAELLPATEWHLENIHLAGNAAAAVDEAAQHGWQHWLLCQQLGVAAAVIAQGLQRCGRGRLHLHRCAPAHTRVPPAHGIHNSQHLPVTDRRQLRRG